MRNTEGGERVSDSKTWLDLARTDGHRFEQWANAMARAEGSLAGVNAPPAGSPLLDTAQEGGDEPPAVERKIPSCVMWADGSGGLRIPVGYSPSGFGTHPVETLGAPGSTGTPSRWPQSSDDTGERGDTQNTGANRGRIGVGGSKGYGPPVEGGVTLDGPEPQTTAVCGSG